MLTSSQFEYVSSLLHEVAGIRLVPGKEGLVRSRLGKRLTALGLAGVGEYLERIDGDAEELSNLVDVLTTNKTSFYREPMHFEYLRERLVPDWTRRGEPVRIWSAGCSSGEEPYTISMELHDAFGGDTECVRILGTDLSSVVLKRARAAEYPAAVVADVPEPLRRRHFEPLPGGTFRIKQHIRRPVRLARLNLMSEWPMRGSFDVIFCRNVMIYFDTATQQRLVERFTRHLAPGGHLFVGHSESLSGFPHSLTYVQPATYAR